MSKILMSWGGVKMAVKFLKSGLLALFFCVLMGGRASATEVQDSLQFRIIFPVNSVVVRVESFGNAKTLSDFNEAFTALRQDKNVDGILLSIRGNASVEGYANKNKILAGNRALALSTFLTSKLSIEDSLIRVLPEQPLSVDMEALLSAFPDEIQGIDLPAIRKISRTESGIRLKQAFQRLDGCSEGPNWLWYKRNILKPARFAEVRVTFTRTLPEPSPTPAPEPTLTPAPEPAPEPAPATEPSPAPAAESVAAPMIEPVQVPEPATAPEPTPESTNESRKNEFRIGTNLLYDVVTVANLSFEYGFKRHAAFNILATFSPWDIRRPDIKIRTLLFQPEFRWYFADNFKGHYLGVEAHFGWYNVALGGRTRYQDKDGNTPLWGGGLSYGYVLPISKHWGMDFGISVGYANLVYDCFYNIENGKKYTTETRNWIGPTKVGVSIYYQF